MKLTARILDRGTDKHYGTLVQIFDEDGYKVGNSLSVWYCASDEYPEGDAAHSPRETEKEWSHWAAGGHYESVADLAVAEYLCAAINRPH